MLQKNYILYLIDVLIKIFDPSVYFVVSIFIWNGEKNHLKNMYNNKAFQ